MVVGFNPIPVTQNNMAHYDCKAFLNRKYNIKLLFSKMTNFTSE